VIQQDLQNPAVRTSKIRHILAIKRTSYSINRSRVRIESAKPLSLAASRRLQFSDSIPANLDANYTGMSLRERTRPGLGIIEPCLPEVF
jgi:hypothetical protein